MASDKGFPDPKALRAEVKKFPYVYVSITLISVLNVMILKPVARPMSAAWARKAAVGRRPMSAFSSLRTMRVRMVRRREEVEEEEEEGRGAWFGPPREVRVRSEEGRGRGGRVKEWEGTFLLVLEEEGLEGRRRRWCGKEGGRRKAVMLMGRRRRRTSRYVQRGRKVADNEEEEEEEEAGDKEEEEEEEEEKSGGGSGLILLRRLLIGSGEATLAMSSSSCRTPAIVAACGGGVVREGRVRLVVGPFAQNARGLMSSVCRVLEKRVASTTAHGSIPDK